METLIQHFRNNMAFHITYNNYCRFVVSTSIHLVSTVFFHLFSCSLLFSSGWVEVATEESQLNNVLYWHGTFHKDWCFGVNTVWPHVPLLIGAPDNIKGMQPPKSSITIFCWGRGWGAVWPLFHVSGVWFACRFLLEDVLNCTQSCWQKEQLFWRTHVVFIVSI